MSAGRFASLSENDLVKITDAKDSENTKNATKFATKTFLTYLSEKDIPQDIDNWTKTELDECLRTFYAELRSGKGELYKRTSLLAIRSGIARHISKTMGFDITKGVEFKKSNDMFTSMCKLVQREGKGDIDHKDGIELTDIKKLYLSVAFNVNSPSGLLNKVWFEICLHFCRRGRENQRELTPSMFAFKTDDKGKEYLCQVRSEVTKNHQGMLSSEQDNKTVRMYATHTELCPVNSVRKYLSKRNPECPALFQTPRNSFMEFESVWYEKRPLGKNRLGSMMADLSKLAKLSTQYTNHCIRATTITALDEAGFEARHIITVSGHRNEASIKSYSRDTSTTQKRKISETLSSLVPREATAPDTSSENNIETHNEQSAESIVVQENADNVMFDENDNIDELLYLSASQSEMVLHDITNFETANQKTIVHEKVNKYNEVHCSTTTTRKQPPSFVFHGCTVNLNYNQ